jgi:hypothetical protein
MAKPKGKGSAVPKIRDVPAVAIVAWVIAIINQSSVKSEQLFSYQFWVKSYESSVI